MYTDNLRNKLKQYMQKESVSMYYIQKQTGIHRQSVKKFLDGNGITYENGMKLKFVLKTNNNKEEVVHEPSCIHFPCTCVVRK
jgi:DNA transposition AAA+ family ATPase